MDTDTIATLSLVVSIVGVLIMVLGLLFQHFKVLVAIRERLTALETKLNPMDRISVRIMALETKMEPLTTISDRLMAMETKMEPFWKMVEKQLPKILHSPHTPEKDKLLEEMMEGRLKSANAKELKKMLTNDLEEMGNGDIHIMVYSMVIARLDQMISEESKKVGKKIHNKPFRKRQVRQPSLQSNTTTHDTRDENG